MEGRRLIKFILKARSFFFTETENIMTLIVGVIAIYEFFIIECID